MAERRPKRQVTPTGPSDLLRTQLPCSAAPPDTSSLSAAAASARTVSDAGDSATATGTRALVKRIWCVASAFKPAALVNVNLISTNAPSDPRSVAATSMMRSTRHAGFGPAAKLVLSPSSGHGVFVAICAHSWCPTQSHTALLHGRAPAPVLADASMRVEPQTPATEGPRRTTTGISGGAAEATRPAKRLTFCTGSVQGSKTGTGRTKLSYCRASSKTLTERKSSISVPTTAPKPSRTTIKRGAPHAQRARPPSAACEKGPKRAAQASVELLDNTLWLNEASKAITNNRPPSTLTAWTACGLLGTWPQNVSLSFTCFSQLAVRDGAGIQAGR
mmetsp:Transcript_101115/g.261881  ORF Transcript_101115/g.261881 Transcript_101115/m.261881 type:complete len:332 (-) Transcript_101115:531-1526(-)